MPLVVLMALLSFAAAPPKPEIDDLIEKLGDDSFDVREDSQARLFRMGDKARGALRRGLKNRDREIATRAGKLLEKLGPGPMAKHIAGLIGKLGDKAFEVRQDSAKALSEIGPEALRQLRAAQKSPDPETRVLARRLVEWLESGGR